MVNSGPGTGKTTTLIAKGLHHARQGEGVILVSYTNASVDEIYERLLTYPGSSELVSKTFRTKSIWCTTIDKIAGTILGYIGETYDEAIQLASSELENRKRSFYQGGGKGLYYRHILIDEAQDIDEMRYQLIANLYTMLRLTSFTAFGDPRQRVLLNRGLWYTKLWTSPNPDVHKHAIGTTYRFSGELLTLANRLSHRRPELHVELSNPITFESTCQGIVASSDDVIASVGRRLLELKVPWRQVAFVTPSLNANNATSRYGMRVMAVLKSLGIPCYTREEGSFRPNAVLFSTIQGIKGKEYDHVYLMGLDDFPMSFPHIEYEVAQSLIFVANTRAKKNLTYLFRRDMAFPEGVSTVSIPVTPWKLDQGRVKKAFGLTNEILPDISFQTFWETNGVKLVSQPEAPLINTLPEAPIGITKRFWGIVCHLSLSLHLANEYPPLLKQIDQAVYLTSEEIRKLPGTIERSIYSGDDHYPAGTLILNSSINTLTPSEATELKEILQAPPGDLTEIQRFRLALFYDILSANHSLSRYDEDLSVDVSLGHKVKLLAEELNDRFGPLLSEYPVQWGERCLGVVDAVGEKDVLEFKTGSIGLKEQQQAYFYGVMTGRPARLINVCTGEVVTVTTDDGSTPEFVGYLLNAFTQLKVHQSLVEERVTNYKRRSISVPSIPMNTFLVDTEFTSTEEIFDIALVNANDIYRSIVQPVRVKDMNMATGWLQQPSATFCHPFSRVMQLLEVVTAQNPDCIPTFMYYHCGVDVKWAGKSSHKVDLAPIARQIANKVGYFSHNGAPPRCSEIYQVLADPLEAREYLQVHTALSDALMLYEMLRTGWQS